MKAILGLSAHYHDSAAALVVDGRIVAAAQEERVPRGKHDHPVPRHPLDYCQREAGLGAGDLDHVVFYEKPFLKFERLLETHLSVAPAGFRTFCMAMPQWIHEKLQLSGQISRGLGNAYKGRYVFTEHHESHAASAFFPSPFEDAAILTLDGVGEWATASIGHGRGNTLSLSHELRFPHSLGLLYSAFTYFCGFRVNSGEYKLMGLAPYGEPVHADRIMGTLMDLRDDGSFRLEMSYFNYCAGLTMTSRRFDLLFGGPPRRPESPVTRRECDLAASIQKVTEIVMLRMAAHAHRLTGSRNLCLAGGVALNCVGNGRILRESPFERIWIQPASGDAGGALGAALFVWHQLLGNARIPPRGARQPEGLAPGARLWSRRNGADAPGQGRGVSEIPWWRGASRGSGAPGRRRKGRRMDAGADGVRAAGPRQPEHPGRCPQRGHAKPDEPQDKVPGVVPALRAHRAQGTGPGVLRDEARRGKPLHAGRRAGAGPISALRRAWPSPPGSDRIHDVRSVVPAVTHVDKPLRPRVQTVDAGRNPRLTRLLEAFAAITGCPVMINTSFNVRGEPVVCTPQEAYHCFMATDIDALVIDDILLLKDEQPAAARPSLDAYLGRYGND